MADKDYIEEWTPLQIKTLIFSILDERRVQIDERFRQIERSTSHADVLLQQYKIDANEYRATFLAREEFNSEHRALQAQMDTMKTNIEQRLSFMDKERSLIRDDVALLKSLKNDVSRLSSMDADLMSIKNRAGYINIAMLISIIFGVSAVAFNIVNYLSGR